MGDWEIGALRSELVASEASNLCCLFSFSPPLARFHVLVSLPYWAEVLIPTNWIGSENARSWMENEAA